MGPGTVVDGRFEIEEEAGRGGMGVVYRARDRAAGGTHVALKVLPVGGEAPRFAREAKVLSRLEHPAIVTHVASGETEEGLLYLAMEWLEGEELAARIAREGLLVTDSLILARRIGEALASAHALGIVHRDVKPSNIYLVGGSVERAKLVDFGIASLRHGSQPLTATGAFVGTLGYVAPEHANGTRDIDGRADIYALGCVLFECLTGTTAFEGEHALEILAKTMLEGVPDVRTRRPNLHPDVAALVARMTAQRREERFASATELCDALAALDIGVPGKPAPSVPKRARLTGEQRLASLAMIVVPDGSLVGSSTLTPAMLEEQERRAHHLVRRFGGELRVLTTGLLVTVTGRGSAVDTAVAAIECALALRVIHPQAESVLTTGRIEANVDVSGVVRRAMSLLERIGGQGHLRVDETTAGLIASRFELGEEDGVSFVVSKIGAHVPVRTLLGKQTPCVGREKELALLEATLDESIDESAARVVLVTASPGTGKTRLRSELQQRIEATRPDVRVLTASADHAASRSALAVAGGLVLDAAGAPSGASIERRFESIRAHVSTLLGPADGERATHLTETLAELCGAPSPLPPSDALASARNDPRLMNERMQRAFEEWIDLLSRAAPLLVVIEDMHWADDASLSYLASAWRRSHDAPIMMLALARPEIHEAMPEILIKGMFQEVRLGGLTKRAAERLVRFALPQIADNQIAHVIERGDGNPFFLEELIRWTATGATRPVEERTGSVGGSITQLPDTVLLMVQSRLEKLPPTARQVLRAASVFGNAAWVEGISGLLGSSVDAPSWVDSLVAEEVLVRQHESRFPGLHEIAFRHNLMREAAYSTLIDDDRVEAHASAARWLESAGEYDPLLLAEHHERGRSPERAAPLFLRAAQLAADAGNLSGTIALSQRGLDGGASGETRALLLATRAHAHGWRAEWDQVMAFAPPAMDLLEPGSVPWWLMAGGIVFASASTANPTLVPSVFQKVLALKTLPAATGPCGFAITLFVMGSLSAGILDAARGFLMRFEQIGMAQGERDRDFAGWLRLARDGVALYVEDDIAKAWREIQEGVRLLDEAMDPVGAPLARVYAGVVALEGGDIESADRLFVEAERMAKASDVHYPQVMARGYRIRSRTALGQYDEALQLAESGFKERDAFLSSLARASAAETYLARRDLDTATTLAEQVLSAPARISIPQTQACSVLARVSLARGDLEGTLAHVDRGLTIAACTALPRCRSELLIARAEAFARLRRPRESEAARLDAAARVQRIAQGLESAGYDRMHQAWMRVPANRLATMAP